MNPQTQDYEPMLRESIKHFLASYRSGNTDFSAFESIFFRLIQTMPDPPLEIAWFYSAVTFHGAKSNPDSTLDKMLVLAKDLFQLLISCFDSGTGLKKTALLAPVVFVLYRIARDLSNDGLCLWREIEDLLDKMFGYILLSCCNDLRNGVESDCLVVCFEELIRVWTIDRVQECDYGEDLKVFFPVLNDEIWKSIDRSCGVGCLAGIVLCEVFWLRLCLKIRSGVLPEELHKDLENCAVRTSNGFQNFYFLDMLLRMLLDPTLPNLLDSEDEVSVMMVIYDTVLLVDTPFLNSGTWIQLLDNQLRNFALMWSLVVDNAVQFARKINDHIRARSYANSFSKSQLSSQLVRWLCNEAGVEEEICRALIGNPRDLIWWISVHEHQGLGVIDQSISRLLSKAVASEAGRGSTLLPEFKTDADLGTEESIFTHSGDIKKREDEVNFDEEMFDHSHDADPASMITNERLTEGRRKRKEGTREVGEPRIKLVKYNFHESAAYLNR